MKNYISTPKSIVFLIIIAIIIATLAAYWPMRSNGFVEFDDAVYITNNPNITGGITPQSFTWAFTKSYASNWHPLTWLSHMLDYRLFGLNPLGHHLVGLLIHILNALLLFWIMYALTGSIWPGAFVAAVFALHPLQVESVAWAAERKNLLGGLFWLLTMAAYIRYAKRPGLGRYILVFIVFALAIMAKPMVVTLPFALLLLDYWPLERLKLGHSADTPALNETNQQKKSVLWLITEKIPMLALSAFSCVMTIIAQKSEGSVIALERIPLNYRIANVFTSYIRYIGKLFWPNRLPIYYSDPNVNLLDFKVIACAVLLILITAISVYTARRRKYVIVGWLWYIGTLVPMIGLVQVGLQAMANRYMYISILGLLIIIAWLVKDIVVKWPRLKIVVIILAAAALTSSVIITYNQVKHWKNAITLFGYALEVTNDNALAENNYGCALSEAGRFDEAELHFKKAIQILPTFADTYDNLGKIYLKQRKPEQALDYFNEVLKYNNNSAEAHFKLAVALGMQNKYNEAIKHLRKALEINPSLPEIHNTLGMALVAVGKTDEAVSQFEQDLKQNENSIEAQYNMAVALGIQNKYSEAIKHLDIVLKLNPDYADARNRMALALLASGRPGEAVTHLYRLLQQSGDSAEIHFKLAMAFSMLKQYDEAIKHFIQVLGLDPNYPEVHNKMGLALLGAGRTNEAVTQLTEALQTSKNPSEVYYNLGTAYSLLKKHDLAIQNLTKAVELNPNNISALNNLAWALATIGDEFIKDPKAIDYARHACEITGYSQPNLLDTLAASYAAAGRFDQAVKTAQKAIDLAKIEGQNELAGEIQQRLELYKAGKPYIQK